MTNELKEILENGKKRLRGKFYSEKSESEKMHFINGFLSCLSACVKIKPQAEKDTARDYLENH